MTDLTERINEISLSYPRSDSHAALIDTIRWLFMVMMERALAAPDWATVITSSASPEDFTEPDYKTVTKTYTDESPEVTVQFRYNYTWASGNKTGIEFQFDDGSGLETVTGGTVVLTYDGSGNFTGATTS